MYLRYLKYLLFDKKKNKNFYEKTIIYENNKRMKLTDYFD